MLIETDLGRDADDFFALLYLIKSGVKISGITITPGDPDQIAVGKFLTKQCGVSIPIFASIPDRAKSSSGGYHYRIMKRFGYPRKEVADGLGEEMFSNLMSPEEDLLIIGPATAFGDYWERNQDVVIPKMTVQGGFIGYDVHGLPCCRLPKFEGLETVPTFNLMGSAKGADAIMSANIQDLKFVSKNVCHSILLTQELYDHYLQIPNNDLEQFYDDCIFYLLEEKPWRVYHDPLAVAMHSHPELGTWVRAKLYRTPEKEYGSRLDENSNSQIIVDVDRPKFWQEIFKLGNSETSPETLAA